MDHPVDPELTIIVNTREKIAPSRDLTYAQVVMLAYPNDPVTDQVGYTITYSNAEKPHEGELAAGQTVRIKRGTIFNVKKTTKS